MIYIPFDKINSVKGYGSAEGKVLILEYSYWLIANAGTFNEDWYWLHGDLYAQGVYVNTAEIAIMFKLSNDI